MFSRIIFLAKNIKPIQNAKMLYIQHWSFKTGYHQKGAEKFLSGGGNYPGVEMIGRYHAPGSLEGWIVLKLTTQRQYINMQLNGVNSLIGKPHLFLVTKKLGQLLPKFTHRQYFLKSVQKSFTF